jgi:biopolymer transport protein TolR
VYLDKSEVELDRLESSIKELRAGNSELSVQLNADQGVNYGIVAKVMSVVDRAGVSRLSVMTASE